MAEGPREEDGRIRRAFMGTSPVPVCRRLHLVAVLLGIVGVLGLMSAGIVAISPTGEGLDDLLPMDKADVMGQVRDADGYLVLGATVSYDAGGLSSQTGTTGWYSLEGLDTGKVVLTMEADGYKTVIKTVHLERGQYNVDFLAEPGTGTVELPGVAIPEATDPGAQTWMMVVGICVASAFALLGAAMAYFHKMYILVVVGCLFGILTWGWFIGSALSVLGLIIVLPLRSQFGPQAIECELPWHEPPPPDMDVPDEGEAAPRGEIAIEVTHIRPGPSERKGAGGMPPV